MFSTFSTVLLAFLGIPLAVMVLILASMMAAYVDGIPSSGDHQRDH